MSKQRLFKLDDGTIGLEACERFVTGAEEDCRRTDRPDLIWMGHISLPHTLNLAAVSHHLAGNQDRARQFATRVAPAAKDYFFGDWRTKVPTDDKKIDPRWWRDKESWSDNFRYAICWAMVLGDWDSVKALAAYPDHGRSMEEDGIEKMPAVRELLIALAEFIRGEKVAHVANEVAKLTGANWRGTMHLARALDEIIAQDSAGVQQHLLDFFKAHHKRKKSKDITDTISIDGTILYLLARHEGLNVILPPKLYVYVIDLSGA
jgi:hypothetical protein